MYSGGEWFLSNILLTKTQRKLMHVILSWGFIIAMSNFGIKNYIKHVTIQNN